jgi:hypothetical protein
MLNILLIECDNRKNLGGSCSRDIRNIYRKSRESKFEINQTMVLTYDKLLSVPSEFQNTPNIIMDELSNYKQRFTEFTSKVQALDYVLICIAGHGYQTSSRDTYEDDHLDEYIVHKGGIILDNELTSLLIDPLDEKTQRIFCLVDTCHSGTMIDHNGFINTFTLSACRDSELDSCDIGNYSGFGGSLTCNLLDLDDAIIEILLKGNLDEIRRIHGSLEQSLRPLNQRPVFQYPGQKPKQKRNICKEQESFCCEL